MACAARTPLRIGPAALTVLVGSAVQHHWSLSVRGGSSSASRCWWRRSRWPLLVLHLVSRNREEVGLLGGAAIIGVSLLLAAATHHLVECPALRGRGGPAGSACWAWPWAGGPLENDIVAVVRWIENGAVDGFVQRLLAAVNP